MSFILGDLLCKGKFSNVYNLENKKNKKKFVIKFIDSKILNKLEIHIMQNLIHPNITPLSSYEQTKKGLTKLIFEKATSDLNNYIKNYKNINLKELSINIAHGIQFLHSKKIIHGDIKPQNILVYNNIAKLSDFGLSCYEYHIPFKILYTKEYRPPETTYSLKSDIWAFGCTLYEIHKTSKSKDLLSLINITTVTKDKRPFISEVINHNYFK